MRKWVTPLEAPPGANGRAIKNDQFRILGPTETEARGQFKHLRLGQPVEHTLRASPTEAVN
jgi:hypothetical protein